MKLIYYHRENLRTKREFAYLEVFYIPNENAILFFRREALPASYSRCKYSFLDNTDGGEHLEEAKSIESGKVPKKDKIYFSNIKTFECEDSKIIELIKNAKLREELNAKVKSGIEGLLKQVGVKKPEGLCKRF